MMWILLALGLVLVIEGLALALAPNRIEQILVLLNAMTPEVRRYLGLGSVAVGVGAIALARWLGVPL